MSSIATLRPRFSEGRAASLARELFGVAGSARPLPSERDQNFLITTDSGEACVLKIASAGEPAESLDLQNQAIEWVRRRDPALPLPRLQRSREGQAMIRATAGTGHTHLVRLLSFLPGVPLANVCPQTKDLLGDLGRFLGRLDRALVDFSHPASERDFVWDLRQATDTVREHQHEIQDVRRRALVEGLAARAGERLAPVMASLRQSVVHNDANDHNVLVSGPSERRRRITGLIDFGDMVRTLTISELAIAIAYVMLDKPDPLTAAAHVVEGYHESLPLTEPELAVLFDLALLRLCTSVALSAHRKTREPENEYLTISEQPAWEALERLELVHPRLAHYILRHACGLQPCPETEALVRWLETQATGLAPVVDLDLERCPKLVFDLSVGSPELESLEMAGDTEALSRRLEGRMREVGAEVGVGRYDEARLLYLSDAFEVTGGERRTIHLGIDLFLAPGSPVFAPLDATVHSFRNNAERLDYGPTIILRHAPPAAPPFFTLYGHLTEDSLAGLEPGQRVTKGQQIARIGTSPTNGDWPPHLHFQIVLDVLDRDGEFPGVAAASERETWLGLCPDPNLMLRMPELAGCERVRGPAELLEARRRWVGPSLSLAYDQPLLIVRGSRQFLYDHTGRAYLDAVNNVCHVGHSHPRVVEAARRQMTVLNTNTRYLHENLLRYAERLTATFPEPLRVCYFVCTGSEANELALRLARAHTRQRDLVVVDGAYHGHTTSLIEASPYKYDGPGGEGAPAHVHKVVMPDAYRGPYRHGEAKLGERYATHVRDAIGAARAQKRGVAAFICESLLGCAGQIVLPAGYLATAYRHAREAGAVCIADEVQVGFGRVGTHFWGFETQGVVPDIVTLGKPIGNGHPLAAVVTTPEIAASFDNGMEYFNTFGGNPVSCAVGMAVLDVLEEEGLQARARDVGAGLLDGLARVMEHHPVIGDVRGLGLFVGVELVIDRTTREPAPEQADYVIQRLREQGILVSTDGPFHNVLKIKPPLVFSADDAARLVAALDGILAEDFVAYR
jgi:4-aminobutyrate aminotransferase-like enzyme/Ser/Thr protein kinase RdoA (MazF antagonist)